MPGLFLFVVSLERSRAGGTGRRAGLKIRWPQGRVGSIPMPGTTVTVHTVDTQKAHFRCISLQSFAEHNLQKTAQVAVFFNISVVLKSVDIDGGSRTHTGSDPQKILSLLRLPVPPLRDCLQPSEC